jgi:hypothetical protein
MIQLTKKQAIILAILTLLVVGFSVVQAYYLGVRNEANYFEKIQLLQLATP